MNVYVYSAILGESSHSTHNKINNQKGTLLGFSEVVLRCQCHWLAPGRIRSSCFPGGHLGI